MESRASFEVFTPGWDKEVARTDGAVYRLDPFEYAQLDEEWDRYQENIIVVDDPFVSIVYETGAAKFEIETPCWNCVDALLDCLDGRASNTAVDDAITAWGGQRIDDF